MAKKTDFKRDPVRETIAQIYQLINRHRKHIMQYGPIIIIAVLFLAYYSYHSKTVESEANIKFGKAMNLFIDGQSDLALLEFQTVVDEYDGTASADYAKLYLIQEAYKNGMLDQVNALVNDLDSNDDEIIQSYMIVLEGHLALDAGDYESALKHYKKAEALIGFPSLQKDIQINVIRANILKGNYQAALDKGQKLLDDENLKFNIKNELEDLLAEAKYLSRM